MKPIELDEKKGVVLGTITVIESIKAFYSVFNYFTSSSLEVDKLWLVPSLDFVRLSNKVKAGVRFKSFYRFSANPNSVRDRWSNFSIGKEKIGSHMVDLLDCIYL